MSLRNKVAATVAAAAIAFTPTVATAQSPLPGGMSSGGSSGNPSTSLIESVEVVPYGSGLQYRVTPTQNARALAPWNALAVDPGPEMEYHGIPNTDSLREQFMCHATFTSGKGTWNLEDYRPHVSSFTYLITGCNP